METSLDSYKASLGLPPDVPVKLDDAILEPFQLVSPKLEALQGELDTFTAEYREMAKAPALASLRTGFTKMKEFHRRLHQAGGRS